MLYITINSLIFSLLLHIHYNNNIRLALISQIYYKISTPRRRVKLFHKIVTKSLASPHGKIVFLLFIIPLLSLCIQRDLFPLQTRLQQLLCTKYLQCKIRFLFRN